MKRIFLTLIPLLFLTISLLPSERAGATNSNFSPNLTALDVIDEVNKLRVARSLPPYEVNTILMSIAQAHADYIASTGIPSHFSADGTHPYQRALTAGYSVAGDLSQGGFFSENINSGPGLTAQQVVNSWQGDADHLNTMISPDLKDIGVGMTIKDGVIYYVLDAGASTDTVSVATSSTIVFTPTRGTPGTPVAVVIVNTALENGEVYHAVRKDEALWSIALAYETTIEQLKLLNALPSDEIFIGQNLLIRRPATSTATPTIAITATFGIPTSTQTLPVTPTITSTPTPLPTPPASLQTARVTVGIIILIAVFGAGIGAWLGKKKSS
jgi:uncharacterized protein YkwD